MPQDNRDSCHAGESPEAAYILGWCRGNIPASFAGALGSIPSPRPRKSGRLYIEGKEEMLNDFYSGFVLCFF